MKITDLTQDDRNMVNEYVAAIAETYRFTQTEVQNIERLGFYKVRLHDVPSKQDVDICLSYTGDLINVYVEEGESDYFPVDPKVLDNLTPREQVTKLFALRYYEFPYSILRDQLRELLHKHNIHLPPDSDDETIVEAYTIALDKVLLKEAE